MPDLDLIKQAEQGWGTGAGGLPGADPAIPPKIGRENCAYRPGALGIDLGEQPCWG